VRTVCTRRAVGAAQAYGRAMIGTSSRRDVSGQNSPLRVAHVVGKMVGGGVESVVMNYYRHIDRDRIQFDFIADRDSTLVPRDEIEALGGRVIAVPPYQQLAEYIPALISTFRANKYVIVHSHLNALGVFPLLAATLAGVPVRIAHSHSTAGGGELLRNVLKNSLRPFSRVFATHFFACSRQAGEWLFGAKAVERGDVTILLNAIELASFAYDPAARERLLGELGLSGHFVVGHVGRFINQKNHAFLIDMFADLVSREPAAALLLVGDGELRPQVEQKVRRLGLADRVRFVGIRQDVADLYQAMDVLVVPSFYEGGPIVAVEAQAAGLACLCSSACSPGVALLDTTRFLSLEQGAASWASAALGCRDMDGRAERSARAQSSSFNIGPCADELGSFYCDVAGESL